jgi:hypothetical protein
MASGTKTTKIASDQETVRRLLGRGEGPTLLPNWHGSFQTFADWVNRATVALRDRAPTCPTTGAPLPALCVDAHGRRCHIGADFMRARDENAFPVYFFFDCLPGDAAKRVPTLTEVQVAQIAAMNLNEMRNKYWRNEENIAKGDSPQGIANKRRLRDVINAIGELKFPGEWNEWDAVAAAGDAP